MVHSQIKRSVLGFASCVLSLIIFLPTSSWAISFALDAGIFGGKYTGEIYFTGPISNLAFSPMQNVRYNDYGTSLLMTPTILNASNTQIEFLILNTEVPPNNCGVSDTSCTVFLRLDIQLNNHYPSHYNLELLGAGRGSDCLPIGACDSPDLPTLPTSPTFGSPAEFLPNQLKPVPEPTTFLLLGSGLLALGGYRWYYRRRERTQVS